MLTSSSSLGLGGTRSLKASLLRGTRLADESAVIRDTDGPADAELIIRPHGAEVDERWSDRVHKWLPDYAEINQTSPAGVTDMIRDGNSHN